MAAQVMLTSMFTALGISHIQNHGIDFWRTCYEFPTRFTEIIDNFLKNSKNSKISSKQINSKGFHIPGQGYNYYYYDEHTWINYITFYKKFTNDGDSYFCYVAPKQIETFKNALTEIFHVPNNRIRTFSIDITSSYYYILMMEKKCFSPNPNQLKAIEYISEWWNESRQLSVCISGQRGVGKTSVGKMLKKYIDIKYSVISKLYDNFNPALDNCPINRLVLCTSSDYTPIILVINEIDLLFDTALGEKEKSVCKSYCRDKQTFLALLDSVADNCNTIVIYTTEKPFTELQDEPNYRSFIRKGRMDIALNMTLDDCECKEI